MKHLLIAILILSAPNAFALDNECLSRIKLVIQTLAPNAAVSLREVRSESIVDYGSLYQMTEVEAVLSEPATATTKTVIVYERPEMKCMIRNIL